MRMLKGWKDGSSSNIAEVKVNSVTQGDSFVSRLVKKYLRLLGIATKKEKNTIVRSRRKMVMVVLCILAHMIGMMLCCYFDVKLAASLTSATVLLILVQRYIDEETKKVTTRSRPFSGIKVLAHTKNWLTKRKRRHNPEKIQPGNPDILDENYEDISEEGCLHCEIMPEESAAISQENSVVTEEHVVGESIFYSDPIV